jgi:hypothetical protein
VRTRIIGLVIVGAIVGATAGLYASDRIGVYAVIDKVVFEPSDAAPERVQIWGAFALADLKDGSAYGAAQNGYLYFSCPRGRESICRKEWYDLKSLAGKNVGAGFGQRYESAARVRKSDEKPSSPDVYVIQNGVVRVENASDRGAETLQVIERLRQALKQR